jgi:flagellin FlaB
LKARFIRLVRRLHSEEKGITGLETAIILIAFVIVASVFAFVVLSTGLFSAERGKETVIAGLEKAQANLELRGDVVADYDGTAVTDLKFSLTLASAGKPVNVDQTATSNRVVINYIDPSVRGTDVPYTTNVLTGNSDKILESGELIEFVVTPPTGATLTTNSTFSIEVVPPAGGTLLITRTLPAKLDTVMDLH